MTNKGKGWHLAIIAAAVMMVGSAWATEYSASFKNTDIEEFINTVGKNLNKTIIIEPSVRGKISVRSYDLFNEEQYYQFFLSVLDVYGFAVVAMDNGVLKVLRARCQDLRHSGGGWQQPGLRRRDGDPGRTGEQRFGARAFPFVASAQRER